MWEDETFEFWFFSKFLPHFPYRYKGMDKSQIPRDVWLGIQVLEVSYCVTGEPEKPPEAAAALAGE
jgi:hypothetical protein